MLWCDYLIQHGILDAATFGPRNAAMLAAYQADQVSAKDFCAFYVGTLDGRSLAEWEPTARAFMAEPIAPAEAASFAIHAPRRSPMSSSP